jgi:hypothetical protein
MKFSYGSVTSRMLLRGGLAALLLTTGLAPLSAGAQSRGLQRFPLTPPPGGGTDPGSSGVVVMRSNPAGPDTLRVFVRDVAPRTCFAMFLTNDPTTGSTPGALLGSFCTNQRGRGRIAVVTEIADGFVFFNRQLDADGDGIVVGQGAGVLASGGFMIPTNVIRIYRAQPDQGVPTVFSRAAGAPGGLHTLSSPALGAAPTPAPLPAPAAVPAPAADPAPAPTPTAAAAPAPAPAG